MGLGVFPSRLPSLSRLRARCLVDQRPFRSSRGPRNRKAQSEISEGERSGLKGLKETAGVWKMGKRLFVPEGVRPDVMKEFHDSPLAGHPGSTKTVELIQRRFWWPNLYKDILLQIFPYSHTFPLSSIYCLTLMATGLCA